MKHKNVKYINIVLELDLLTILIRAVFCSPKWIFNYLKDQVFLVIIGLLKDVMIL